MATLPLYAFILLGVPLAGIMLGLSIVLVNVSEKLDQWRNAKKRAAGLPADPPLFYGAEQYAPGDTLTPERPSQATITKASATRKRGGAKIIQSNEDDSEFMEKVAERAALLRRQAGE